MAKIADLIPDEKNANRGTQRGLAALDNSLRQYGAGRSILVDRHGRVIAGNKTLERAADIGLDEVEIVDSDGSKLVAVRRTDLDLETDERARMLAYADNRVGELDLYFDPLQIVADLEAGLNLDELWNGEELSKILDQSGELLARSPTDPANDPNAEWRGMPEFENEAQAARTLHIHFRTIDDCYKFCKLLDVEITENTKTVWYPAAPERIRYVFKDES